MREQRAGRQGAAGRGALLVREYCGQVPRVGVKRA